MLLLLALLLLRDSDRLFVSVSNDLPCSLFLTLADATDAIPGTIASAPSSTTVGEISPLLLLLSASASKESIVNVPLLTVDIVCRSETRGSAGMLLCVSWCLLFFLSLSFGSADDDDFLLPPTLP